jgi:hypothetical protein
MNRFLALFASFLLAPLATAAPPAKAEIDHTLEAMSAAAIAGDKPTFLAYVDTTEPYFAQEEAAWCNDLAKRKPVEVRFALADDPVPALSDNVVRGTLVVHYKSQAGAATKGTQAQWPAVFVRKGDRWLYAGEDWKTLEGDGFVVKFFPGSEHIAEMVLKAFPVARAHDDEGFGVTTKPQQIKLFKSMDHLKATVYLNQPDPVLMGWNEPGESIKFMENYATTVERWTAAFAHEYGHVATWEYGKAIKDAPWWVSEGVAELAAEDFLPGSREALDREIKGKAKAGELVPWEKMADYDLAEQSVKHMAYHQGHHMLGYISERWGREGRQKWLRAMGAGKTLDQATRDVMGMPFDDLDKAWRASLDGPEDAKREPASEHESALKAELIAVGQAMSAAAVAGNTEGYLSHVYRGDKEFLKEQTYFANDLHRKPAEQCHLEIGDMELGDGTAEGTVTWIWKMPAEVDAGGASLEKKERSVSFKARWIKEAAGWMYAGETWERHGAAGVLVLCDPGLDELAKRTVAAFGEVRGHVEEGFGLENAALPKKIQKIKLYGSMRHLQQSICLSYEDGLGGWNEPGESIKLLASADSSLGTLRHLLAHEYGHVATFELGPHANDAPWWVLEGVADLAAEKYGGTSNAKVQRWAKNGQLAEWADLADFHNFDKKYYRNVYDQGHHMLGYISERWGRAGRIKWLTAMAQGKSIDEATQEAFGMPFAQLDKEWRATLPKPEPKEEKVEQPVRAK